MARAAEEGERQDGPRPDRRFLPNLAHFGLQIELREGPHHLLHKWRGHVLDRFRGQFPPVKPPKSASLACHACRHAPHSQILENGRVAPTLGRLALELGQTRECPLGPCGQHAKTDKLDGRINRAHHVGDRPQVRIVHPGILLAKLVVCPLPLVDRPAHQASRRGIEIHGPEGNRLVGRLHPLPKAPRLLVIVEGHNVFIEHAPHVQAQLVVRLAFPLILGALVAPNEIRKAFHRVAGEAPEGVQELAHAPPHALVYLFQIPQFLDFLLAGQ